MSPPTPIVPGQDYLWSFDYQYLAGSGTPEAAFFCGGDGVDPCGSFRGDLRFFNGPVDVDGNTTGGFVAETVVGIGVDVNGDGAMDSADLDLWASTGSMQMTVPAGSVSSDIRISTNFNAIDGAVRLDNVSVQPILTNDWLAEDVVVLDSEAVAVDTWHTFSQTYTVPGSDTLSADPTKADFQFSSLFDAFAGTALLDNVGLVVTSAPALEGDLDGDGFVGITDLNLVLSNWNQNVPPADPAADPSGDDFIGIEDLNIVLGNWNAGTPPASSEVPEPASIALLGLSGIAMLRRRH